MKQHTFGEWMLAVRPWSFPASAMPIIVILTYLLWSGAEVNWLKGIWVLLTMIAFHAAGNTWSDYFDFKKGTFQKVHVLLFVQRLWGQVQQFGLSAQHVCFHLVNLWT